MGDRPAFSIVTDGTRKGTQVLDVNGEPIPGITGFSFTLDAEGMPELEIRLNAAALQAVAYEGIVIATCPACGEGIAHPCVGPPP